MALPSRTRKLDYAPTLERPARPRWAYAVVDAYLLLLFGFCAMPAFCAVSRENLGWNRNDVVIVASTVGIFLLSGSLLLFIHVRTHRKNVIGRRSIWFPLTGATILIAILCFAAGLATYELLAPTWENEKLRFFVFLAAGLIWLLWLVIFWMVSRSLDPLTMSARLYKTVLGGTVVELLIAVPMHLVVRRRTECCAGWFTGFAICLGAATALVAFGPGIFILYHRRWRQVYDPERRRSDDAATRKDSDAFSNTRT